LSHILAFFVTLSLRHSLFYIYRQVALKVLSHLTGAACQVTVWRRHCCFHTGSFHMHCGNVHRSTVQQ